MSPTLTPTDAESDLRADATIPVLACAGSHRSSRVLFAPNDNPDATLRQAWIAPTVTVPALISGAGKWASVPMYMAARPSRFAGIAVRISGPTMHIGESYLEPIVDLDVLRQFASIVADGRSPASVAIPTHNDERYALVIASVVRRARLRARPGVLLSVQHCRDDGITISHDPLGNAHSHTFPRTHSDVIVDPAKFAAAVEDLGRVAETCETVLVTFAASSAYAGQRAWSQLREPA